MATDKALPSTTALPAKFFYGIGAIAYGIKDNGFSYLLLIYYNQVLGLPQNLVGTGIFIALMFDALSDPLVGTASDNLRSRWGRRHPFMYAAAPAVAVCYFLLWAPPEGLSDLALFTYFLTMAILVRTTITFYEIPSSSLVAELTEDYHQRTSFLSWRHFFGWWGALALAVFTYSSLLVPTPEQPVGVLNRAGYETYGVIASIAMFLVILASAMGTHRYIPQLKQPPQYRKTPITGMFRQTWETVQNHSFGVLFLSALFGSLATGVSSSMTIYLSTFYWELDNEQIAVMTSMLFVSAFCAMMLAPRISRIDGKKTATILVGLAAAIFSPLPILLRSVGLFPDNGTDLLFYTLIGFNVFEVTLLITTAILMDSMIADIVEQSQLQTGRRSEGVFFAARNFVRKSVSGVGVLIATTMLTIINFPSDAQPGTVAPDIIFNLGLLYAPVMFILFLLSITVIFAYRISQTSHEDHLRQLDLNNAE